MNDGMRGRSIKDQAAEAVELTRGVEERSRSLDPEELDAAAHLAKRASDILQDVADQLGSQAMALRFPPDGA
jgi:hypothetical protein